MVDRRTWVNLAAICVASAILLVYAFARLLAGALFDQTYPLSMRLPRSGGVIAGQQVTLNGVRIGKVTDVRLDGGEVVAALSVVDSARVPTNTSAVVLRRTPVGEQGIDLRPTGPPASYYAPGETIAPTRLDLPPEIQDLVETANGVFGPIAPEDAQVVVHEVAEAVRGRRGEIRAILADSAAFSEAVADHGEDYDRLFASSRVVNTELAEHRDTIARLITESADAADTLAAIRDDVEGLLATAPPVLADVDRTVGRSQANLSCAITDLANLNQYLAEPRQLDNLAAAFRANQFFFVGFSIVSPEDREGDTWQRIQLVLHLTPPATSYLPAKRPIPPIRGGDACNSPFGTGAPGAAQDDYRRTIPEAEGPR